MPIAPVSWSSSAQDEEKDGDAVDARPCSRCRENDRRPARARASRPAARGACSTWLLIRCSRSPLAARRRLSSLHSLYCISRMKCPLRMIITRSQRPTSSGQVGGDQQHRAALPRELLDGGVDGHLGADVHAARRLVQDEHPRLAGKPLGQEDLLLVAAGEVADGARRVGRVDRELADEALDRGLARAPWRRPRPATAGRRSPRGCCRPRRAGGRGPRSCGPR